MGIVTVVTNDGFLLPSAPNFRDLGGHRTKEGRTVRDGLLYRSDALHTLTEQERTTYDGFGIRQLIDLRSSHERDRLPDLIPDGAEYTAIGVQRTESAGANFIDLFGDPEQARIAFGDGAAEKYMYEVYRGLVTDTEALDGYRDLVERAAKGPTSLVFHCSAGKDRTGWARPCCSPSWVWTARSSSPTTWSATTARRPPITGCACCPRKAAFRGRTSSR